MSLHREVVLTTADPPPKGVPNPIHDGEGAAAAGYSGALVAGVRTYGWAVQVISRAIGEEWYDSGWVDFQLRRPLFAGEDLQIEVQPDGSQWTLRCWVDGPEGERVVLDGSAGLGEAEWLSELNPPASAAAAEAPAEKPGYTLDTIPLREPLTPLGAYVTGTAALDMVKQDLRIAGSAVDRYTGENAQVHPYFLAGRMAPLTRHNFTYGPTIHVRSQIQHLRSPAADREFVVGAQIVDAYERKGHAYQVLDGVVTDDTGEVCRIRHHTIFKPRGT